MKYSLLIGKRTKHWKTNVEEFNGNFINTNLKFGLIKKAIKVIKVAELVSWRITKQDKYGCTNYNDIVQESPDITEFFKRENKKRKELTKEQERRIEAINKLPKSFLIKDIGKMLNIKGFKVYIDRTDYYYKPNYSSQIQGYIKFRFEKDDTACGTNHFSISTYITSSGNYQKAKFKREIYWELGIKNKMLPKDFNYKKLLIAFRTIENQYKKMILEV